MKPLLPKQHGAWAMLLIPFVLGVGASQPSWIHIPLFIGWFFLYLATYPALMAVKKKNRVLYLKWATIYFMPVVLSMIVILLYNYRFIYFGALMLPFFLINIYFASKNKERALINDISAIFTFSIGGIASYYAGNGSVDGIAIMIAILSILFFLGSAFFVKTMIREKKNPIYKWISWIFHLCVLITILSLGYYVLILAYVPSVIRAFYLYGKTISIMKIGILEIGNSVIFLIITFIFLSS